MSYDDLVILLARRTGLHSEIVKKVMVHLPDVLQELGVGEDVRTPLGVFRKHTRKARAITLPNQTTVAEVAPHTVVRLRPGSRLKEEG